MIEPTEQTSGPGSTNRTRVVSSLVMAVLILLFSFYTELAGMRILEPETSLGKALSAQFIISALSNMIGAMAVGIFFFLLCLIPPSVRKWALAYSFIPVGAGAVTFLLAMLYLVNMVP